MNLCMVYHVGKVRLPVVPKLVRISWLGVAPQTGEMKSQKLSYYNLPYLFEPN
jgi:hypothetical protein